MLNASRASSSTGDPELQAVIARYSNAWAGNHTNVESAPVTTLVPLHSYLKVRTSPAMSSLSDPAQFRCQVCAIDTTSAEHLATHIKGQKHLKRVVLADADKEVSAAYADAHATDAAGSNSNILTKISFAKWRCEPCASDMCVRAVFMHMDGARHRIQLRKWLATLAAQRLSCRPCSYTAGSEAALDVHLASQSHARAVAPAASPERTSPAPSSATTAATASAVSPPKSPTASVDKHKHSGSPNSPKQLNAFAKEFRPSSNSPPLRPGFIGEVLSKFENAGETTSVGEKEPKTLQLFNKEGTTPSGTQSSNDSPQKTAESGMPEQTCSCNLSKISPLKRKISDTFSVSPVMSVEIMPASKLCTSSDQGRLRVNPTKCTSSVEAVSTSRGPCDNIDEAPSTQSKPEEAPSQPTKQDGGTTATERKISSTLTDKSLTGDEVVNETREKFSQELGDKEMQCEKPVRSEASADAVDKDKGLQGEGSKEMRGVTTARLYGSDEKMGEKVRLSAERVEPQECATPLVKIVMDDADMATASAASPTMDGSSSTVDRMAISAATSSMSQMSSQRTKSITILKKNKGKTNSKAASERDLSAFYCARCDVQCNAEPPYQEHLRSIRHLRAVSATECGRGRTLSPAANVKVKGKNSPPRKKKKCTTSTEDFSCQICNVTCNGSEPMREHMRSAKHMRRTAEAAQGQRNKSAGALATRANVPSSSSGSQSTAFLCNVCNVPCSGADNYRAHIAGKAHKRRLTTTQREGGGRV